MMKKSLIVIAALFILGLVVTISGYNKIQTLDESTKASASEIINQYKRRADLINNLVYTVKGYAQHEQEIFIKVTQARSKVGQMNINAASLTDEAVMQQYQQAQNELSSQLSRLLLVTENYPDLKASELYKGLMAQLEGTENRIAVARGRYIDTVKEYNTLLRQFPYVMIAYAMNYQPKAQFTVADENIDQAPKVNFN